MRHFEKAPRGEYHYEYARATEHLAQHTVTLCHGVLLAVTLAIDWEFTTAQVIRYTVAKRPLNVISSSTLLARAEFGIFVV